MTRIFALVVCTALLSVLPVSAEAAPSPAVAAATKAAKPRVDKKKRAQIRRVLQRQLRKNPTAVMRRSFLRRAALVDFKLPLTIRLNRAPGVNGPEPSDDQIEITWDDSVIQWPLEGAGGTLPGVQTSQLSGQFSVESSFSDSDGYGVLGGMETVLGGRIAMTATPFVISDFAGPCLANPQLEVAPNTLVSVTSAGPRYGLMNLYSGDFRGSLWLRMTFAGQAWNGCGGTASATDTVDNSAAPPMPLRFDGKWRITPGVTSDGKMRLGVLEVDDAVTPQLSTFAYVRACTGSAPCNAMQFPARLKLKTMRAEVLLGDAF